MVLTNNRLQCQLHPPLLIEVITIQRLNQHPVAEATEVEKVVAMVGEMARAREEEFTLGTPVRLIAPTP